MPPRRPPPGHAAAARRVMFLAGVFLDDTDPIGLTAPSSLDFGSGDLGRSFTSLAPGLRQTFYVGDGLARRGRTGAR